MDKLQEAFEQEFAAKIQTLVDQALEHVDVAQLVEATIDSRLNSEEFKQHVDATIQRHLESSAIRTVALERAEQSSRKVMLDHMPAAVKNVNARVDEVLEEVVSARVKSASWPDHSIDGRLVNTDTLAITTANITDYAASTGIEDLAPTVQLTVLDDSVVVENQFVAKNIQCKTLESERLSVAEVDTDQPWYSELQTATLALVPEHTDYDADIARINSELKRIDKSKYKIKELDVPGEALLSDTLYTTPGNNRVGINTMDPSDALSVWDNEVEVVVGKHKTQTGYVGTRRRQDLVLGSNNTVGITVKSTGEAVLDKPVLCGRSVTSSKTVPGHAARTGDIVLNEKPAVGKPVGWICLDGIKWAEFGTVN